MKNSDYTAHLGDYESFEKQISEIMGDYSDKSDGLVFISDGEKWQWNWIGVEYPEATQILDLYHAMEHLGKYLKLVMAREELGLQMEYLGKALKTSFWI